MPGKRLDSLASPVAYVHRFHHGETPAEEDAASPDPPIYVVRSRSPKNVARIDHMEFKGLVAAIPRGTSVSGPTLRFYIVSGSSVQEALAWPMDPMVTPKASEHDMVFKGLIAQLLADGARDTKSRAEYELFHIAGGYSIDFCVPKTLACAGDHRGLVPRTTHIALVLETGQTCYTLLKLPVLPDAASPTLDAMLVDDEVIL